MYSREVPLLTNNSNFPSISLQTPMIMNVMVVVAKGYNMLQPKLLIVSLGMKR
jgi:hypothetical protein